jgi:hypothetical protein
MVDNVHRSVAVRSERWTWFAMGSERPESKEGTITRARARSGACEVKLDKQKVRFAARVRALTSRPKLTLQQQEHNLTEVTSTSV